MIEENILINSQLVDSDFFLGDRKWRRLPHHPSLLLPDPVSDAIMTTPASGDARFAATVDMGISSSIAGFAYHALTTYLGHTAGYAADALMES